MEKITIKNMPLDTLYEFSQDNYVMKRKIEKDKEYGNYSYNTSGMTFTEVYRQVDNNLPSLEWSGRLVDNPNIYNEEGLDKDNYFAIFSYDMDCARSFKQTKDLTLAPDEIKEAIIETETKKTR